MSLVLSRRGAYNCVMRVSHIQSILDHISLGRVAAVRSVRRGVYIVTTNQATFVVIRHPEDPFPWSRRLREMRVRRAVQDSIGPMQRITLPDCTGQHREESSYIHYHGRYYSVYELLLEKAA